MRRRYFSFREKEILPMDAVRYSDNLDEINMGKSKVAEEKSSVIGRIQKLQSEIEKSTDMESVKKSKNKETSIE